MSIHTPREVAHARAISPQFDRLHALWCNRIVRARVDARDFSALVEQGFAVRTWGGPRLYANQCDYLITPRGMARASELF